MQTDAQSQAPAGERRTDWIGLYFGLLVAIFAAFVQFKLPPVLPEMLVLFRYRPEIAGGFMSIFAVVGLLASVKIGRLMQRQATAAWLVGACLLVGLGAVPILLFPEWDLAVLAGRGVEGMAMAILAIAGPTLMTRNAAPRHLPIAMALAATWIPLGGLLATIVARLSGTWTAVWWVGLGLAVLVALTTLALNRNGGRRIALPTAKGGAQDLSPSDRRMLTLVAVCFAFWALQNLSVLSWVPEYLVSNRGLPDSTAKELYGVFVIVVALSNLFAAVPLRLGVPIVPLLATVLVGQGLVLMIGPSAGTDWTGLAAIIAYALIAGITPTCIFALPDALLGENRTGSAAFGLLMTGRNLGVLVGPVFIGWVGASAWGWQAAWWSAAASTLCAMLASLVLLVVAKRVRRAAS